MLREIDLSYLDTLIGSLEDDLSAKLLAGLTDENFTVAMFRAGFLKAVVDENGVIVGWNFNPPQNFDMMLTGTSGADNLVSGSGADIILSGEGNDTVVAGAGNDTLMGGAGNDSLNGGTGDDTLDGESGNDAVDGGDGRDTLLVNANAADFSFDFVDAATVVMTDDNGIYGTDTVLNVETFRFNDGIFTRAELEALFSGPNEITGTTGDDNIVGTADEDVIYGFGGSDIIHGGDENDVIYGDAGNDTLYGDAGNDVLYGGDSIDFLYGGAGADTFAFDMASASTGVDRVQDFSIAQGDKLDISDLIAAYDPLTHAIEDFVRITDNGVNSTVSVDVDGGGNSFATVAIVLNTTGLTDEQLQVNNGTLVV